VALKPRVTMACAALAVGLLLGRAAVAQDVPAPSPLEVISRGPAPEVRIHGVSLKSVRSDDAQNAVAFDFNGPVSDEAFARLADELPDWVEMAYAGYDNAVIRAKRPVTFMTKAESDGFSLRLVPRDAAAASPGATAGLRGDADTCGGRCPPPGAAPPGGPAPLAPHQWRAAESFYTRAAAERPFDVALRGFYDSVREGGTTYVALDGDWRHTRGTTLITSNGHLDIETWEGVHLLADVHDVVVNSKATRQFGGAVAPFNGNNVSGSAGLGYTFDGATATAEALYGAPGWGARVGLEYGDGDFRIGGRAAWHEPYTDTAEAVALRGARDYSAIYAADQVFDGLWAVGEVRATRYGIRIDDDVAETIGWHGGLRYDIGGWPFSLTYDGDGEYVLNSHKYAGSPPTPFVPLSIRDREVHQFGGSFSDKWDNAFWFDLYGGWAIDRYSDQGPYGGLALRFTPGPGFDVALDGRYSTVAERQGEQGHELSGGVKLTLALNGDAPITHGGPAL
jgi:hypothetical protein